MIAVARINKLFGVDGEVIINLYNTFPDNFSTQTPLFAKVDSLNVPLYCEKFERRGRTNAQVSFADIDTQRRITEFLGMELYCPESDDQSEYEDSDEFFMEDLIGFAVEANGFAGEFTEFYDNKNNPLFGVRLDGREGEILIPAAEEFITYIDFEGGRIEFSLPEGLLEL
ncbi:MAG: ribosome maturation factor RimM [Rikenellaceae bacterium]